MSKGFYLYCVRPRTEFALLWGKKTGFSPVKVEKTIGGGEVSIIPYEELEAVTSLVDLNEFGSEEIPRKAQEDLNWIKEKAQIHEYVIEQAMRLGSNPISVIPMKFGTIFKTKEGLRNCLRDHHEQFKESLEKLKGKQEWGIKVYLKENIFRKAIEEKNEQVLAKKKEIGSMPKGMAFFAQKQIDEMVNQEKDKELDRITEEIYECLGQLAFSKNKDKLLEKDFTGRTEEMVLNAFYLIEEKKLAQFQIKVEELKGKYNPIGIEVETSGPWPSYHFA
ncbi:GvpL/GvpF family gas vesicle protein [Candidatus Roizmanbacteria bacterium]|nr:GvpL/GvpF family gas vesicle protein [Candidatus Roizmanbacteria bacterium]